jgi:septal ring factor EnvC (AmiA/AmiB activator)
VQLREAIAERDLAAASLSRERQALRAQIRAAYVLGRQERLKLLLRQGEPESVGRALIYYDYLHAARGRRISTYSGELEALRALQADINRHRAEIEVLQNTQAEELVAQQAVLRERQEVLATLQHRLAGNQNTLRVLERDEAALRNLVKELQTALRELERGRQKAPFAARRGKMELPVLGELTIGHGEQPAARVAGAQGVTLVAAAGTEIRAVHGGQVVFADWLNGFGLLLIIDHGEEYLSIYAHNQSLYRRVGDWVGMGDVIATVGNSGGQPRAALYFEIRHRGAALDPLSWFAGMS